jgi:hypothetical protein
MAFPRVNSPSLPATPTIVAAAFLAAALIVGSTLARPPSGTMARTEATARLVVLEGSIGADGSFQVGGSDALHLGAARQLVSASGATVHADLSDQIGVMVVSATPAVASTLVASGLVAEAAPDFSWKASRRWTS